jgi:hypothetical protein
MRHEAAANLLERLVPREADRVEPIIVGVPLEPHADLTIMLL